MKSEYPVKVTVIGKHYWIVLDKEEPWEAQLIVWYYNEDSGTVNRLSDNVLVDVSRADLFFQPYHAQWYLEELRKIDLHLEQVDLCEAVEYMSDKTLSDDQPSSLSGYRHSYIDGRYTLAWFTDGSVVIAVSSCDGPPCDSCDCDVNPPVFYVGTPL